MDEAQAIKQSATRSAGMDAEAAAILKRLVRHTPARWPVRDIGERMLSGQPLTTADVNVLLSYLGESSNARWSAKELSARLLGEARLDDGQREAAGEALLRVLTRSHKQDKLGGARRGIIRTAKISLVSLAVCWALGGHTVAQFAAVLLSSFLICVVPVMGVSAAIEQSRVDRARAAAAASLGKLRVKPSVHALADLVTEPWARQTQGWSSIRTAARPAIRMLLASLTRGDYGQLPPQTVPALCRLLRQSSELMALEILRAFELIGDGRAVDVVEQVNAHGATPELRNAAGRLLPTLLERRRQERDQERLLRPAEPVASGAFLRPATGVEPNEALLLRPGAPDTDP